MAEDFQFLEFQPAAGSSTEEYDATVNTKAKETKSKTNGTGISANFIEIIVNFLFAALSSDLSQLSLSQLSQSTQQTSHLSLSQTPNVAESWEDR
jgi:hypothetical protein